MRWRSGTKKRTSGSSLVVVVALLAGCSTPLPLPTPTIPGSPRATGGSQVQPSGTPTVLASGLDAPWSIERLTNGSTLISERDTAVIKELTADGTIREVGTVPGVDPGGEGGLLGIDTLTNSDGTWLYAYLTAATDNRIVRMRLEGWAGALALGGASVVLKGIAKAGNHDGGRIKFGPDGKLYATTGDAGQPARAQDPKSLNGKILRMTPAGAVPDDNPIKGSLVYSMGHRNPQGIAWDESGQLWASEFGQNTWDELNVIQPGKNYGWPQVEGIGGVAGFVDPVYQWPTSEASPSGLAFVGNTFFLAALRGQRLWAIYPKPGRVDAVAWYSGVYGRLRDVVPGPNGSIWVLTNNTDGRGTPQKGDDKLLEIRLTKLVEG